MPRVSEAHLAARRQQILDAAQATFLRNGFHATSMQDLIAASGMSAGAIYRYFRSKNEIIAAIAEQYAGGMAATVRELADDPTKSVTEVMRAAITLMDIHTESGGIGYLAIQVWAEAVRDDGVGAIVNTMYTRIRDTFAAVARRAIENGELPPDTDPLEAGANLFSLVLGYGLQRMLTGRPDREAYLRGMGAILRPGGATDIR